MLLVEQVNIFKFLPNKQIENFTPNFERDNFQENKCWTYTKLEPLTRYWIFYNFNNDKKKERYNIEIEFLAEGINITKKILIRWIPTLEKAMELAESLQNPSDSIDLTKFNVLSSIDMRWL